jgi:hypothetical protein
MEMVDRKEDTYRALARCILQNALLPWTDPLRFAVELLLDLRTLNHDITKDLVHYVTRWDFLSYNELGVRILQHFGYTDVVEALMTEWSHAEYSNERPWYTWFRHSSAEKAFQNYLHATNYPSGNILLDYARTIGPSLQSCCLINIVSIAVKNDLQEYGELCAYVMSLLGRKPPNRYLIISPDRSKKLNLDLIPLDRIPISKCFEDPAYEDIQILFPNMNVNAEDTLSTYLGAHLRKDKHTPSVTPSVTFWEFTYRRHTNFDIEHIESELIPARIQARDVCLDLFKVPKPTRFLEADLRRDLRVLAHAINHPSHKKHHDREVHHMQSRTRDRGHSSIRKQQRRR